jgi:hypothetical protein
MGELHLEIVRSRLMDEYKVELLTSMFFFGTHYFGFLRPSGLLTQIKSPILRASIAHAPGPLKVAYRERAGHDVKHFAHNIKREMSNIMFVSCVVSPSVWLPLLRRSPRTFDFTVSCCRAQHCVQWPQRGRSASAVGRTGI